ncbi:hypothetical protein QR680_011421 [Steinernema hermaphroditum]|uniref:Uncharacterized protein n=1 Tax=Steinernema hermaphroditum TaxID=289476 RepID=A0AA39LYY6_9BILA|nr:hypothetical protein QR680_011421 [Steinernema hermaphroditum]
MRTLHNLQTESVEMETQIVKETMKGWYHELSQHLKGHHSRARRVAPLAEAAMVPLLSALAGSSGGAGAAVVWCEHGKGSDLCSGGGAIKSHWSVYCDRPRKELQETRALRSFNVTHSKRQVLLPIDIREIKTVLLYAAIRAALDEVMEEQRQLEPQLLRNDEGVSPEKPANDH